VRPAPDLDLSAGDLVTSVLAHAPTLGAGHLVCVDGPAGSGKTTLAAALGRRLRESLGAPAPLVHLDDVYPGWSGLAQGMEIVATSVVAPLRAGRPGRYRRYDWHTGRFAEERVVPPGGVLVLEGVGAGAAAYADAVTLLVWVDAPADVRLARGLARDGESMRDRWLAWQEQEEAMFVRERTRERSQVVVDGLTGTIQR